MKCPVIILAVFLSSVPVSANTTSVVTGNLINLYSLQKTRLPGTYNIPWNNYSPPCSLNTDTLKLYDFIYEYDQVCACGCPCCPLIRISSPRAFYRSNAPMNYSAFNPSLLATQFTKISGPERSSVCSTQPSVTYGITGAMAIDSISSRLFVFQTNNGGKLPYYLYAIVHIDTLLPYQYGCDEGPPIGFQVYPLYNNARISIYMGPIVSIKQIATPVYTRRGSKDLNLFTIFGKRIDKSRVGELPAGIYIINGEKLFLQKNANHNWGRTYTTH
jgi:hypothetical protein